MKPIKELEKILVDELNSHKDSISFDIQNDYYNEILGDTSSILSGILESLLLEKSNGWDRRKWIDDSLLLDVKLQNKKVSIIGIMIWGRKYTTEQWVSPFYFELIFRNDFLDFVEYTFLFDNSKFGEISYDDFNQNRTYWNEKFRSNNDDWRYVLNVHCESH